MSKEWYKIIQIYLKNHLPREHFEAKAAAILKGNFYSQPNQQGSSILCSATEKMQTNNSGKENGYMFEI